MFRRCWLRRNRPQLPVVAQGRGGNRVNSAELSSSITAVAMPYLYRSRQPSSLQPELMEMCTALRNAVQQSQNQDQLAAVAASVTTARGALQFLQAAATVERHRRQHTDKELSDEAYDEKTVQSVVALVCVALLRHPSLRPTCTAEWAATASALVDIGVTDATAFDQIFEEASSQHAKALLSAVPTTQHATLAVDGFAAALPLTSPPYRTRDVQFTVSFIVVVYLPHHCRSVFRLSALLKHCCLQLLDANKRHLTHSLCMPLIEKTVALEAFAGREFSYLLYFLRCHDFHRTRADVTTALLQLFCAALCNKRANPLANARVLAELIHVQFLLPETTTNAIVTTLTQTCVDAIAVKYSPPGCLAVLAACLSWQARLTPPTQREGSTGFSRDTKSELRQVLNKAVSKLYDELWRRKPSEMEGVTLGTIREMSERDLAQVIRGMS